MRELDPRPWLFVYSHMIGSAIRTSDPLRTSVFEFAPREGYEQDRAKYPCNALCSILTA